MAEALASKSTETTDGFPFNVVSRLSFRGGTGALHDAGDSAQTNGTASKARDQLRELPDLPSFLKQIPGDRSDRSEPQGRRSVQFARLPENELPTDTADGTRDEQGQNGQPRPLSERRGSRTGALLSKLKMRPYPPRDTHIRTPSELTVGVSSSINDRFDTGMSSASEVLTPAESTAEYGSENEADEEGSNDETPDRLTPMLRPRRKSRRPYEGVQTAPTTPKSPSPMQHIRPGFFSSLSQQANEPFSRPGVVRRATTTDLEDGGRQGVSEDEGRSRMARKSPSPWRRGKRLIPHRSSSNQQLKSEESGRPGAFRRAMSTLGTSTPPNDPVSPSPWKLRRNQTVSAGAARWRQIKAGLKAIGRQKKDLNPMDTLKSAELLNQLTAGVPAALMVASIFQRDEGGSKKIPILLEQLKVKLTNSQAIIGKSGDRHLTFQIDLEYGSGLTRMKWTIERTLRDFYFLHLKYYKYRNPVKTRHYVQGEGDDARAKLPHFPNTVLPYLRGARGLDVDADGAAELDGDQGNHSSADQAGRKRPPKKRGSTMHGILRRQSSLGIEESPADAMRGISNAGVQLRKESWPERSRRKLDDYLQQLIRYLTFRPGTNRLCKFLELSALGVRLAAEGSYHGKEGRMTILSGKGIDFRRALKPDLFKDRHSPKWFLVRHSYLVCTESPQDVDIYDVFLVDSEFRLQAKEKLRSTTEPETAVVGANGQPKKRAAGRHHLTLYNSERKVKLAAKNARQLAQFTQSIRAMAHNSPWLKKNRFNSFAPIRRNVFAQWLVDGRDYMWNVSRAISMAKDVIYIHDWWLSPELYLRRPAAISSKWRLDRLLKQKAEEGVKVFVIMYRNVESAIPIDSIHSKTSLLDLHPNVSVQRSPNQLRQATFFWAHHEKICIVDHIIAFVGGIDLCFGRWDTPQHVLADDKPTGFEDMALPKTADNCQLWPGKDYSNPRVQDFYGLDRPYEEMYDRSKIPRMPWHDVHMQVVGQPARDLARHFVQRWNFVLRSRVPSRPTPFLLPPPDFAPGELEDMGLDGTCEVQILRSCTEWSIGTPGKTEHSIMDAYCTTIKHSEHFVYIENQFFITSCEVNGVKIENSIGDALVERIIRAYTNDEPWRATIVIPLMPGFQNTVDAQDGTSVRLIMQCQFRSISRGEGSIFHRLRVAGIDPQDYIQFYSLRSWGKIGPTGTVITEQLYIHAKVMIVDDRVAIIASANINERSQLGDRDSECGAVVRDADMLWSTMAGKPYQVGRFPHKLRMRLMREHLGLDVDCLEDPSHEVEPPDEGLSSDSDLDKPKGPLAKLRKWRARQSEAEPPTRSLPTAQDGLLRGVRVTGNTGIEKLESEEESRPVTAHEDETRSRANSTQNRHGRASTETEPAPLPPANIIHMHTQELCLPQVSTLPALPAGDDTDIGGPAMHRMLSSRTAARVAPLLARIKRPELLPDCMKDPLADDFYNAIWHTIAENNTALFRSVFRCQPDNEVTTWKDYHDYMAYAERFSQAQGAGKSVEREAQESQGKHTGPPGAGSTNEKLAMLGAPGKVAGKVAEGVDKLIERTQSATEETLDEKRHIHHSLFDGAVQQAHESKEARLLRDEKLEGRFDARSPSFDTSRAPTRQSTTDPGFELNDEKVAFPAFAADGASQMGTLDQLTTAQSIGREHSGSLTGSVTVAASSTAATNGSKLQLQLPTETNAASASAAAAAGNMSTSGSRRTRRSTTATRGRRRTTVGGGPNEDLIPKEDAEELLGLVQGHLVLWPYDWLAKEDQQGNWLYHIDQLAPLEIYD